MSLKSHLVQGGFSGISTFFRSRCFVKSSSVLEKVVVGKSFGFLRLQFVLLEFSLQLADKFLHSGVVLCVFISLEGKFLHLTLLLSEVLVEVGVVFALCFVISVKTIVLGLEGGNCLFGSLKGGSLGIIQLHGQSVVLAFKSLLELLEGSDGVALCLPVF